MDIKKTILSLHPLERKVLPHLISHSSVEAVMKSAGMQSIEVLRAMQWLEGKGLVTLSEEVKESVELDYNGESYLKEGLPEMRFLQALANAPAEGLSMDEVKKNAHLSDEEFGVSIGSLRSKAALSMSPERRFSITGAGRKVLESKSPEELFLKKGFPLEASSLSPEDRYAFEMLRKRKSIIKIAQSKNISAKLTAEGHEIAKMDLTQSEAIDSLTPKMLADGSWKGKDFRAYDVSLPVPKIYGGRRHYVRQSIDYAKNIWTDMGFKEMEGPMLNTSFWNFDALFTAQDHPVRDLQDTFYIKNPKEGKLPGKKLVEEVRESHEKGVAGSVGWQYRWNEAEAKKNVMRTHTTVLSARTIAALKKEDLPAKFFAVGRCFRNEAVDWCHLFEFNQTEGIVIDPNANFRHLLGYLKAFFKKMGYEKVRFRPAHFPYTEPSVEMDVFHPVHKRWVELGGAGVFRPEVVVPLLGEDIPVLAWGPGFDRIMTEYYNITDLRDLYRNDLKQIRELKNWMRD